MRGRLLDEPKALNRRKGIKMKNLILLAAAFSFAALSGPASAETTVPTTKKGVEAVCGKGKDSCSMEPCGSTYCSAYCDKKGCNVIIFMKKPKTPPVVDNRNRHS
jgi:hypothetical protein